jgi:hypothetical protein
MNLDWAWLQRNAFDGTNIAALLGEHALLAIVPVVAALVAAIPLGYLVFKTGRVANPILAVFGVIYSIPSLALFVALPLVIPPRSSARSTWPWPWPSTPSLCWSAAWWTDCGPCRTRSNSPPPQWGTAGSPGCSGSSSRWPCR